jgi:hypothetical protein
MSDKNLKQFDPEAPTNHESGSPSSSSTVKDSSSIKSNSKLQVDPTYVRVPLSKPKFALVYLGLALAILLAALDQTIVSTALKAITEELKQQDFIPWIGSAYLLTATSTSALYGKFADVFGRKWVFVFAILVFEIGSFICGAASSMPMLVVGRGVAGIGEYFVVFFLIVSAETGWSCFFLAFMSCMALKRAIFMVEFSAGFLHSESDRSHRFLKTTF